MARFGKLPIEIPEKVEVTYKDRTMTVKGPKGELVREFPRLVEAKVEDKEINITRKNDTKKAKALQGTYRSLVVNMIKGVVDGWEKSLELVGAGYRPSLQGKDLSLTVGYSHPVVIKAPEGIEFKVEKNDITVSGIDKDLVGMISAKIRAVRKPEPYKGKGIKYKDEVIRRKAGKQAGKAEGAA